MKVCFFSPTAYPYFNPQGTTTAGGAEIQQILVARHMAARGIDVSFIVGDYGQPDVELAGGITLIKSFAPGMGNRKLRFVPDMLKIRRAMRIADADIFNQRSTSFFTGQLAFFAAQLGRLFTFSIGIDYNCYPDGGGLLPLPVSLLYRYGIKHSAAVIAQSEDQRRTFRENFGTDPVVIRNGIEIVPPGAPASTQPGAAGPEGSEPPASGEGGIGEPAVSRTPERPEFLWVGSIRRRKRPEIFLEFARMVPEADFTLIGGEGDDDEFYREIIADAREIGNLRYEGFVPPHEISSYYRRAYAYVNTSHIEGFPNTYLHSWMYGVPTLTVEIDPDRIIEENGIGVRAGSLEGLVEAVRSLRNNPGLRADMSKRARAYVEKNHDIAVTGDRYIELFERLVTSSPRSRSSRSG